TLMGYMGGRQALTVAELGAAEAIAVALRELNALFGVDAAAVYRAGRLVDWSRDSWSRGAYTYSAAGTPAARVALAEPVGPLFFAGEATVTGAEIATVHGALETGRRAARTILLRNRQIQTHL
ncbi:MAG: FAD-dependent oxidoreductase, partial [Chloroflexus sp.]